MTDLPEPELMGCGVDVASRARGALPGYSRLFGRVVDRLPRARGAVDVARRPGAHASVERHSVELAFEQKPRPGRYAVFFTGSPPPGFPPARRARVCRGCHECHGRGVPTMGRVETGGMS
jgi:hypothetical protein